MQTRADVTTADNVAANAERIGRRPSSPLHFRSPLRYPGGKQKAIQQIAQRLPKSVREYREPMVDGGSVFLHARAEGIARKYWINDRFTELISFWQTVQDKRVCP